MRWLLRILGASIVVLALATLAVAAETLLGPSPADMAGFASVVLLLPMVVVLAIGVVVWLGATTGARWARLAAAAWGALALLLTQWFGVVGARGSSLVDPLSLAPYALALAGISGIAWALAPRGG
jgi:hypothetical protein